MTLEQLGYWFPRIERAVPWADVESLPTIVPVGWAIIITIHGRTYEKITTVEQARALVREKT